MSESSPLEKQTVESKTIEVPVIDMEKKTRKKKVIDQNMLIYIGGGALLLGAYYLSRKNTQPIVQPIYPVYQITNPPALPIVEKKQEKEIPRVIQTESYLPPRSPWI